jgi:hypothetical protein
MSPQRTKTRLAATCPPLILLAACAWGEALDSNPSAWHPAEVKIESPLPQPSADEAGAEPAPAADCTGTPPYQHDLRRSTSEGLSHRASEPCLAGCHEPGGTAQLAFAAAGSAYSAQGVRMAASPGNLVRGVGGTELEVDACGNFYAIADALTTNVRNTQPWVKGASFHRMEKPLAKNARAGDCNQSGCHDFSGRLNSGIYY